MSSVEGSRDVFIKILRDVEETRVHTSARSWQEFLCEVGRGHGYITTPLGEQPLWEELRALEGSDLCERLQRDYDFYFDEYDVLLAVYDRTKSPLSW